MGGYVSLILLFPVWLQLAAKQYDTIPQTSDGVHYDRPRQKHRLLDWGCTTHAAVDRTAGQIGVAYTYTQTGAKRFLRTKKVWRDAAVDAHLEAAATRRLWRR